MFENFVEELCEREDLIDVARLGKASQSSLSKWSKDNDAQRAISGEAYKDYAFHTDKEKNAWWRIDFDDAIPIQHIILQNRKKHPYDMIASSITIKGVNENNEVINLHQGNVFFGHLPKSMPMIIPLYNKLKLKSLIIENENNDYLHLLRVNILCRSLGNNLINNKNNFFVNRTDGLGERLRALVHAIILSEYSEGRYFFSWKERKGSANIFHSTSQAEKLFKKEYIAKHLLSWEEINELNLYPAKKLRKLESTNIGDGYLVQRTEDIKEIIENSGHVFKRSDYRIAFNSIGFSQSLLLVKSYAENIQLREKVVAIHLRSGDVVYGNIRRAHGFMEKVIPLYILDKLIRVFKQKGYQVVIFGQDGELCEFLENEYNVTNSEKLAQEKYNETEKALFDIILMSRCEKIFAGNSGFAIIASWIGSGDIKSYYDYIDHDTIVESFNSSLDKKGIIRNETIHPLMRSFSIVHYLDSYKSEINNLDKIFLLKESLKLDPDNSYTKLVVFLIMYREGMKDEADNILYKDISSNKNFGLPWTFSALINKKIIFDNSTKILESYIKEITTLSDNGSLVSSIVLIIYYKSNNKTIDIGYWKNKLKKHSVSSIGYEYLQSLLVD